MRRREAQAKWSPAFAAEKKKIIVWRLLCAKNSALLTIFVRERQPTIFVRVKTPLASHSVDATVINGRLSIGDGASAELSRSQAVINEVSRSKRAMCGRRHALFKRRGVASADLHVRTARKSVEGEGSGWRRWSCAPRTTALCTNVASIVAPLRGDRKASAGAAASSSPSSSSSFSLLVDGKRASSLSSYHVVWPNQRHIRLYAKCKSTNRNRGANDFRPRRPFFFVVVVVPNGAVLDVAAP